jgi:hypothetical protein
LGAAYFFNPAGVVRNAEEVLKYVLRPEAVIYNTHPLVPEGVPWFFAWKMLTGDGEVGSRGGASATCAAWWASEALGYGNLYDCLFSQRLKYVATETTWGGRSFQKPWLRSLLWGTTPEYGLGDPGYLNAARSLLCGLPLLRELDGTNVVGFIVDVVPKDAPAPRGGGGPVAHRGAYPTEEQWAAWAAAGCRPDQLGGLVTAFTGEAAPAQAALPGDDVKGLKFCSEYFDDSKPTFRMRRIQTRSITAQGRSQTDQYVSGAPAGQLRGINPLTERFGQPAGRQLASVMNLIGNVTVAQTELWQWECKVMRPLIAKRASGERASKDLYFPPLRARERSACGCDCTVVFSNGQVQRMDALQAIAYSAFSNQTLGSATLGTEAAWRANTLVLRHPKNVEARLPPLAIDLRLGLLSNEPSSKYLLPEPETQEERTWNSFLAKLAPYDRPVQTDNPEDTRYQRAMALQYPWELRSVYESVFAGGQSRAVRAYRDELANLVAANWALVPPVLSEQTCLGIRRGLEAGADEATVLSWFALPDGEELDGQNANRFPRDGERSPLIPVFIGESLRDKRVY